MKRQIVLKLDKRLLLLLNNQDRLKRATKEDFNFTILYNKNIELTLAILSKGNNNFGPVV
jgi:hypothetical protein